jgi:hypothetical protein
MFWWLVWGFDTHSSSQYVSNLKFSQEIGQASEWGFLPADYQGSGRGGSISPSRAIPYERSKVLSRTLAPSKR